MKGLNSIIVASIATYAAIVDTAMPAAAASPSNVRRRHLASCGNGQVNSNQGEECDPPDGITCDINCKLIVSSSTSSTTTQVGTTQSATTTTAGATTTMATTQATNSGSGTCAGTTITCSFDSDCPGSCSKSSDSCTSDSECPSPPNGNKCRQQGPCEFPSTTTATTSVATTTSTPPVTTTAAATTTSTTTAVATTTTTTTASDPLTFCVIADTPYSAAEACMLNYTIGTRPAEYGYGLKAGDCEFLIHLGDIRDGQPYNSATTTTSDDSARPCPESLYSSVLTNIFKNAPMPTFFIPGDNGWLDCSNADAAYGYWTTHLFPFNDLHWPNSDLVTVASPGLEVGNYIVERSSIDKGDGSGYVRTELFSIYVKDRQILLFGMSLPAGGKNNGYEDTTNGRNKLQQDNTAWLSDQLTKYDTATYGIKGVVLCGHAMGTSSSSNSGFRGQFESITNQYSNIPFLVLLDNQHYFWTPEVPLYGPNDSNRWRIDVDDTVTPLIVSFDPNLWHADGTMPVTYDRGCDCTTGHRPTQILTTGDPCLPYCQEIYNNCPMCSSQSGSADLCSASGAYSQSVNGVFDLSAGPPYNVCTSDSTADNVKCPGLRYHQSLSRTRILDGNNEVTAEDGEIAADLSRYL